jgi:hypothetical protein
MRNQIQLKNSHGHGPQNEMYIDTLKSLNNLKINAKERTTSSLSSIYNEEQTRLTFLVQGCFFHFGQCLFKQIKDEAKLKTEYSQDPILRKWFKKVVSLALIPKNKVSA